VKCPHLTILFCMTAAAAAAQSVADGPVFEVASVKVAAPYDRIGYRDEGGPGTRSPGQWTCTNVPLNALVMKAWNLNGYRLSGPSSMGDARYDIVAKVPPGASREDFNLMIRRLLMERLGLAVHQETKELSVRELVIARGGLKMKPAEAAPTGAPAAGPRLTWDKDRNPQLPPGYPLMTRGATTEGMFLVGRMQGIDELARALPAGQMVVDKTGLTGKYDYLLEFALPSAAARPVPVADAADAAPVATGPVASTTAPLLESAIVEQLGLQLRPAKAVVDVLVVDRFNKVPTEN